MSRFDDKSIKEDLKAIDEDETVEVSSQEADFIEQVLYKQDYPLTAKQASYALNIIEKYQR